MADGSLSGGGGGAGPGVAPFFADSDIRFYMNGFNNSNFSVVNDRLDLVPVIFSKAATLTSIGLHATSGVAGAFARLGLYEQDPADGSFTLVNDYGTTSLASSGISSISISETLNVDKLYWFAVVIDENSSSVTLNGGGTSSPGWMFSDSSNTAFRGIFKTGVGTGALAAAYSWSDFSINTSSVPAILVQGNY